MPLPTMGGIPPGARPTGDPILDQIITEQMAVWGARFADVIGEVSAMNNPNANGAMRFGAYARAIASYQVYSALQAAGYAWGTYLITPAMAGAVGLGSLFTLGLATWGVMQFVTDDTPPPDALPLAPMFPMQLNELNEDVNFPAALPAAALTAPVAPAPFDSLGLSPSAIAAKGVAAFMNAVIESGRLHAIDVGPAGNMGVFGATAGKLGFQYSDLDGVGPATTAPNTTDGTAGLSIGPSTGGVGGGQGGVGGPSIDGGAQS